MKILFVKLHINMFVKIPYECVMEVQKAAALF